LGRQNPKRARRSDNMPEADTRTYVPTNLYGPTRARRAPDADRNGALACAVHGSAPGGPAAPARAVLQ